MQHRPIVFLDIETTGGSPHWSRITEIGAIRIENGAVSGVFNQLIDPECAVPPFITRLTGINNAMVSGQPTFKDVATELEQFLDQAIFVAHHVNFDYGFIREEYRRLGRMFRMDRGCTVRLDRLLYPAQHSHALDRIIERQGIDVAHRHRAFDDAAVLWEYFEFEWQARGLEIFRNFEKTLITTRSNIL
ncbi:3'-5' exonuclease [Candidatus Saccharibacteria bacterium]|nr:MAG: 3'-5' exonuclease [Candidatus Saccharibacteria bacterium]